MGDTQRIASQQYCNKMCIEKNVCKWLQIRPKIKSLLLFPCTQTRGGHYFLGTFLSRLLAVQLQLICASLFTYNVHSIYTYNTVYVSVKWETERKSDFQEYSMKYELNTWLPIPHSFCISLFSLSSLGISFLPSLLVPTCTQILFCLIYTVRYGMDILQFN